jgi:hypothetical protein
MGCGIPSILLRVSTIILPDPFAEISLGDNFQTPVGGPVYPPASFVSPDHLARG